MSGVEIGLAVAAFAGAVAQGYATNQEAKAQSRIEKDNAKILRENAYRKRLEASINEDNLRRENRQKMAKNLAASIEQGNANSSTAMGALGQQSTTLEQNALNLRYEGLSAAENYDIQSNYMNQQAKITRKQGKNAFNMSFVKGAISAMGAYYSAGGGAAGGAGKTISSGGGSMASGSANLGNGISESWGGSYSYAYKKL